MKKRQSKRKRPRTVTCSSDDMIFETGLFKHLSDASVRDAQTMEPVAKRRKSEIADEKAKVAPRVEVKKRRKRKLRKVTVTHGSLNLHSSESCFGRRSEDAFNTKLASAFSEGCVLPVVGFHQAAEELIHQVCNIAKRCFYPRLVSVRPFGSLAQDTCISSSDVDMCVFFVDGPEPLGRGKSGKLLRSLGREMRRPPATKSLQIVDEILEATVPILKVRSLGSQSLEADISLGSRQQTSCDEVVRSLLEKEVVAQQCVLLVKYWAQREAVNKAYHGFPSSFSWVLLTTFYLQRVGVLPCKHRPARESHQRSLQELLVGFYLFCMSSELNDKRHGISVARGDFRKLAEPTQVLFIEVPGEPSHNAARCLRPEQWELVLQKVQKALSLLTSDTADKFLCTLIDGRAEKSQERLAPPWSDSEDSVAGHFHDLDDIDDI